MINIYGADDNQMQIIDRVYQGLLQEFQLEDIFTIDISFLDKTTMRELNNRTRGIDTDTDVLSFPYVEISYPIDIIDYPNDIDMETGRLLLGEMMICYPVVQEQSRLYGTTLDREMAYITIHGLLHLLGYDHIEDLDRREMRLKEETILINIGYGRDE